MRRDGNTSIWSGHCGRVALLTLMPGALHAFRTIRRHLLFLPTRFSRPVSTRLVLRRPLSSSTIGRSPAITSLVLEHAIDDCLFGLLNFKRLEMRSRWQKMSLLMKWVRPCGLAECFSVVFNSLESLDIPRDCPTTLLNSHNHVAVQNFRRSS